MSIANEKLNIRQNSGNFEWLLWKSGLYYQEMLDLTRMLNRYSERSHLGKALAKRAEAVTVLRRYVRQQILKKHSKEVD